jgi:hypothetical protein
MTKTCKTSNIWECDNSDIKKFIDINDENLRNIECSIRKRCNFPIKINFILILILILLFIGLIIWNASLAKELQKNTKTINDLVSKLSSTST